MRVLMFNAESPVHRTELFVEEISESLLQNNHTFLYFVTIYYFFKSQYSCFHLRTSNLGISQDSSKIIEA